MYNDNENTKTNATKLKRYYTILMALLLTLSLFSCEDIITVEISESVRLASLPSRNLIILPPQDGSVSPGAGSYVLKDGEPFDLSVTANAGFGFLYWYQAGGSGVASFEDHFASSTAVSVRGGDAVIQAVIDDNSYTISFASANATMGSVDPVSLDVTKDIQHATAVVATPTTDYLFDRWAVIAGLPESIDFDPNATTASVRITAGAGNATIEARFKPKTYTMTMANDGYGYTLPYTSANINAGAATTITAYPYSTYTFDHWEKTAGAGNAAFASPTASSTTVTVTGGAVTVKAYFRKRVVSLTEMGSLAFINNSTYPISGSAYYRNGNLLYIYGDQSASNSVVREVNISSVAAPTSTNYRYVTGKARAMIGDGTYLVMGSSSNLYRMGLSGFSPSSTLSASSTVFPIIDLAPSYEYGSHIWAATTNTPAGEGIVSIRKDNFYFAEFYISDATYEYKYIQASGRGLIAVRADNQDGYIDLATYDIDGLSGPTTTMPDDEYILYNGGEMWPGTPGKPVVNADREFAYVPVYDSDNEVSIVRIFEITDYSSSSYEGQFTLSATVNGMACDEDDYYLYIAAETPSGAGLYVVDVSNVNSPVVVASTIIPTVTFEKADLVGFFTAGGLKYIYCLLDTDAGMPTFRIYRVNLN